ncbi:hypothetical protein NM688_g8813 [Phlebia brevispora]|uniref:Uncharacterized protein n=1 Tax=Phlebia brevispora TaxID=194682 RepID=A0ACC1RS18_9APHY|nr:hypothetical protein NM688_g8813 [Phlebia brevispora]
MSGILALADAIHLENRPLPKAPDGRYDWQVRPKTAPDASAAATHSYLYKAVQGAEGTVKRIKAFNPKLIVRGPCLILVSAFSNAHLPTLFSSVLGI